MTDYITAHQAAELTGYSYQYIIKALAAGKIDGAQRFSDIWQIPRAWAETHKKTPTVTQQAKDAGVSRQTFYLKKKNNSQ